MTSPLLAPTSSTLSADRKTRSVPRNPVSLRLYKVLGTNFNDESTQEALQTLSELYAGPVEGTAKGKEPLHTLNIDGALQNETSPGDASWSEVVPGESAAQARKHLRRDMEMKLAEGSREFLKAFEEVDRKLEELQTHVAAMHADCDEAEKQLAMTTQSSAQVLERAGNLSEERCAGRENARRREQEIHRVLFLDRFTLNDKEIEAITSRDVEVGKQFFHAMDKTERVRTDCRVLMAGEDGPTQAGRDIMASTSSYLEQGYEKLLRWCSYEFRQLGKDMQVEVGTTMREAVRRLRRRPELLNEALAILSQIRQATLMSAFLTALTRGGPSGLPRPIELHAHDPMRYVGDMLAWVHQAIAAEREFLESLFGVQGDGRMVGSVRTFAKKSEEEDWIRDLMDSAVEKLCVPLKVRIQQTIRSQESSIISYKIANLLQFYMMTMRRTIGETAVLSTTLDEITQLAYKVFYDAIEAQGRNLVRATLDLDDPSLSAPLVILDHAQILREIMNVYESSLLGDEDEAERAAGFRRILDVTVDPAIEFSTTVGEEKKRMRPRWDRDVYVLNCLTYLLSVLEPFSFTSEKQVALQKVIDQHVSLLSEEHYKNVMSDAGIYHVAETCAAHDGTEPLSRVPATLPSQIQTALRAFSLWLSGPEVVQSPRLSQLTAQRVHIQIHQAVLQRMARAYLLISQQVRKPENKYEAAATLLGSERPFGQVNLLLQIFGLEGDSLDG
ncbi:unnamed protein product [Mycena citricolor]|uniref:Conserved oligomeric Golgi complex subunit 6 n=1 Tax=Mycena citricolor TaxID=2018698 RepID=A0AAD2HQ35_9AGAR|nr:unnamed protein product [Mycena citricolor]